MSLINISNLTFAYPGSYDNIFENVSIQLDSDWKLGFTGRNGRGKTTLLNLLLGKYKYSGTISSSVTFDYFPFEIPDKSLNTIEIIEGLNCELQLWEIQKELNLLNVSDDVFYRPFNTLSNGEQTKILLASLFLKGNNFLLIDEPTNHLDSEARIMVSKYLSAKKGFILVSHDRMFLDNCVDHILSINKSNIDIQKGNFSSWWHNKELQDNFELAENEKLQKDIKKLSVAASRTASWSDKVEKTKYGTRNSGIKPDKGYLGHKASKMMRRAKAIEDRQQSMIHEKSKLLKNLETADNLSINPIIYHNKRLLELSNLSINFDSKKVCEGIKLTVNRGNRIALKGKNGSGKSSILKLIHGENISYTGNLYIGSNLIVSYVSQDTSFLSGYLKDFANYHSIDESLFKTILRKFDFSRVQFEKDISSFSEGQKKKVLLAKSLCEKAHLYIWDEPLNFIDILSRMQLEKLILDFCPTLLFVEHDQAFVENIATQVVEL